MAQITMAQLNPARIGAADIRRAAMDLLARREHGYDELIRKLLSRFLSAASDLGFMVFGQSLVE